MKKRRVSSFFSLQRWTQVRIDRILPKLASDELGKFLELPSGKVQALLSIEQLVVDAVDPVKGLIISDTDLDLQDDLVPKEVLLLRETDKYGPYCPDIFTSVDWVASDFSLKLYAVILSNVPLSRSPTRF